MTRTSSALRKCTQNVLSLSVVPFLESKLRHVVDRSTSSLLVLHNGRCSTSNSLVLLLCLSTTFKIMLYVVRGDALLPAIHSPPVLLLGPEYLAINLATGVMDPQRMFHERPSGGGSMGKMPASSTRCNFDLSLLVLFCGDLLPIYLFIEVIMSFLAQMRTDCWTSHV